MQRVLLRLVVQCALFVPAFCLTVKAQMTSVPKYTGQAITSLADGKLLATGGFDKSGKAIGEAYLIDLNGITHQVVHGLVYPRGEHTATALPDGTVLIFGGRTGGGNYIRQMEIYDPKTSRFSVWTGPPLLPRCKHTATLLTNGRLVVIGGTGDGGAFPTDIQLWDFRDGSIEAVDVKPVFPRQGATAKLLANGRVLLMAGRDPQGKIVTNNESYDPDMNTFQVEPGGSEVSSEGNGLVLADSIPIDGASDLPIGSILCLRFSELIDVGTATTETVRLLDSSGSTVATTVTAAEAGRLVFVIPATALKQGADYILNVQGVAEPNRQQLDDTSIRFHTAGEIDDGSDDAWVPDPAAFAGNWSTRSGSSSWQNLPPLRAPHGVTALAGQVLGLSGKPLSGVTLQIEDVNTKTDNSGRFLLRNIGPGHHVLVIDGQTASHGNVSYGLYEAGVDIKVAITNVLNYTIWMTRLDTQHAIHIPSPTTLSDTVIKTPLLPGLELHLPRNTTIIDREGHPVSELTITPIPLDKPPFPLPTGVRVPIYFTVQPGGSEISVNSGRQGFHGAQLYYPNTYNDPVGTTYDFWNYDAAGKGWYIYGKGAVSPDRKTIKPNPGVLVYELTGAMVGENGAEPPIAPGDRKDGDPVDLSSGQFIYTKTDLAIADTIRIQLVRTYITNDHYQRSFGVGATNNYDIFMVGDTFPYTYQELVLSDGTRIRFNRTSPGTGFTGAVFTSASSGGPWYGATISYDDTSNIFPNTSWLLRTRTGLLLAFPDGSGQNDQVHQALIGIEDRYGNKVTLTRDANSRLTKITSPNGRFISLEVDPQGRIVQASDNAGRVVAYTYDLSSRLSSVTDANGGVTKFTYTTADQVETITDARNITYLTNQYDSYGRVSQQQMIDGSVYQFGWTPSSNTAQVWTSTSSGQANVNRYNNAASEGYTALIAQVNVTDPRGYVRQVVLDSLGRVTTETAALGQAEQETSSYEYYADNLLKSTTDPMGRTTTFDYDSLANLTTIKQLVGTDNPIQSALTYDQTYSNVLTATDSLGHTTAFEYDSHGALIQIQDPLGHVSHFSSTSEGLPASFIDAIGNRVSFDYAGADLSTITDPLGNTTTLLTDQLGRLTSITDAQGHQTRYTEDNLDQVVGITDALGNNTALSYDANGNVLTLTDPLNHITTNTYDNMDRISTRTDPLQRQQSYTYDLAGQVSTFTDRKGQVSSYTFDGIRRLVAARFGVQSGSGGAGSDSNISYSYDAGNRLLQTVDSVGGTITRNYDLLDRLTSEITPQGSISYTYDNAGRRSTMHVAGQLQVAYTWDDSNRLTGITQGANSVGFTYDNANRRSTLTLPNQTVASYSFDEDSHVVGISYSLGGNLIGDLTYTYDSLGRRTSMGGSLAALNLPQPLSLATYDAANELSNWNGASISYDLNGNVANDSVHSYSWDARNQLASIDSGGAASFSYDAFGRRIGKTITGVSSKTFLYDRADAVQEQDAGLPIANLLTGRTDEYFVRTDSTGSLFFLTDALRSTLALSDATGAIQTQYAYDPFGSTTQSGVATTNSLAYTGREFDTAGIYYYRARYYNPGLGRFLNEDPIGFRGGMNFYVHAKDSPTKYVDPFGLSVTVSFYGGAGPNVFGHVGIQVNGGQAYGFDPAPWAGALTPFTTVPGEVDPVDPNRVPLDQVIINTNTEQENEILDFIQQRLSNPGFYNLFGRNCTTFVEDALSSAGFTTPRDIVPKRLLHDLHLAFDAPAPVASGEIPLGDGLLMPEDPF